MSQIKKLTNLSAVLLLAGMGSTISPVFAASNIGGDFDEFGGVNKDSASQVQVEAAEEQPVLAAEGLLAEIGVETQPNAEVATVEVEPAASIDPLASLEDAITDSGSTVSVSQNAPEATVQQPTMEASKPVEPIAPVIVAQPEVAQPEVAQPEVAQQADTQKVVGISPEAVMKHCLFGANAESMSQAQKIDCISRAKQDVLEASSYLDSYILMNEKFAEIDSFRSTGTPSTDFVETVHFDQDDEKPSTAYVPPAPQVELYERFGSIIVVKDGDQIIKLSEGKKYKGKVLAVNSSGAVTWGSKELPRAVSE